MTPTAEACDALVRLGIPAELVVPGDMCAAARYNGLLLVATWVERDALRGWGWQVYAVAGRASHVRRADGALVGLVAAVEEIREAWETTTEHAPMAQQLADAERERRIAELGAA